VKALSLSEKEDESVDRLLRQADSHGKVHNKPNHTAVPFGRYSSTPLLPEPRASDAESNVIEKRAGVGNVEASVAKLANDLSSYCSLEARDGVTVKDRYSTDSYFSVEAGDG
jgi:hypothetical protein